MTDSSEVDENELALLKHVSELSPLQGLQFGVACVHEIMQVANETIRLEIPPEQRTQLHKIFGEVQRAVGEKRFISHERNSELREELSLCSSAGQDTIAHRWITALDCLLQYDEFPHSNLLMAISRELMATLKSLSAPPPPQQNWPRVPRRRVSVR